MSKYLSIALEIVKILGLEETDENILKYSKVVEQKSFIEKYVEQALTTEHEQVNLDYNKGAQ